MKELYPKVPVVTIRSLPLGKIDRKDQYECPLYKTQARRVGGCVAHPSREVGLGGPTALLHGSSKRIVWLW